MNRSGMGLYRREQDARRIAWGAMQEQARDLGQAEFRKWIEGDSWLLDYEPGSRGYQTPGLKAIGQESPETAPKMSLCLQQIEGIKRVLTNAVTGMAHILGWCRREPNLPIRHTLSRAMTRTGIEVTMDVRNLNTLSELACRIGIRSKRTFEFKGQVREFGEQMLEEAIRLKALFEAEILKTAKRKPDDGNDDGTTYEKDLMLTRAGDMFETDENPRDSYDRGGQEGEGDGHSDRHEGDKESSHQQAGVAMEMVQGLEDVSGIGGYGYNSQIVRRRLHDLRRAVRRLAELADSSGRPARHNDASDARDSPGPQETPAQKSVPKKGD